MAEIRQPLTELDGRRSPIEARWYMSVLNGSHGLNAKKSRFGWRLGYCLVLASLSVRAGERDEVRSRAIEAYDKTLHFMDRVDLSTGDRVTLESLQRKIETRLLLADRISVQE